MTEKYTPTMPVHGRTNGKVIQPAYRAHGPVEPDLVIALRPDQLILAQISGLPPERLGELIKD